MATIKTIKPNGGGDYTSLQAWENDADGEASADQTAECYNDGGDLGQVTVAGWASTPTSTLFPLITVPVAERHTGQSGTGAFLNVTSTSTNGVSLGVAFARCVGLRIVASGTSCGGIDVVTAFNGQVIDSNLIEWTSSSPGSAIAISVASVNINFTNAITIKNNFVIANSSGQTFQNAIIFSCVEFGTAITATGNIYNNTVYKLAGTLTRGINLTRQALVSGITMTANVKNNIVMDATTCFTNPTNSGTGSLTRNGANNMSSDTTADDWDGSGSLISKTASSQFVNTASDWNLVTGADAKNAGADLSGVGVDVDYKGTSRPQGASYDIGAHEFVIAASSLIKTINGLAIASVKTVNGLAIASVKTINGLTNV